MCPASFLTCSRINIIVGWAMPTVLTGLLSVGTAHPTDSPSPALPIKGDKAESSGTPPPSGGGDETMVLLLNVVCAGMLDERE